jgi:PAS domain S-box-containing protein
MIEPLRAKVNPFAPIATADEASLAVRIQSLTCLLRLGRAIELEDHIDRVNAEVPNILVEGLSRDEPMGVRLVLGNASSHSTGFAPTPYVWRKKILSQQSPVGEIEIHFSEREALSPEQEDLLSAVAERLGRFYQRKGLQSALERSERRYQQLFRQARDGIVLVDAETGMIVDANESFLDLAGLSLDQLRSRRIRELVAPEHRDEFEADLERAVTERERQWLSLPIMTAARGTLDLEVSCSVIHFAEHEVLQFICRDITERLNLTRRLTESENRYRALFDSTPVAMILCDAQGLVLDVNTCLLSKFYHDEAGKERLIGRHLLELELCDLGGQQTQFMQFLRGVCVQLREVPIPESPYRPAGAANVRCIPLTDARGEVEGGVVIIEDITTVREAQRAMIQSAKMAAVGQMTSGFAHELGTPLGIISANAQYLLKETAGLPCVEELRIILSETNRITNLIQQLLIFSRPAKFRMSPTAINDIVRDVLGLMQSQEIMRGVKVETDLSPEIPPLSLEPTLIKQVFLNLIINACQAMPSGGKLTISSRMSRSQAGGGKHGPHVEVMFRDAGEGISGTNLRKIFTPFFTTKEVGKGTGLGLSVSYRIVEIHGGTIVAESRGPQRGATFRVYLPVGAAAETTPECDSDSIHVPGGGQTDENR